MCVCECMYVSVCECLRTCLYVHVCVRVHYAYVRIRICVCVCGYVLPPHPPSLPTDLVLDVGIRAVRFQEIREVGGTVASGHVQRSLPARVLFVGVVLGLQQQLAQTFELVLRRDVQWVVAVFGISDVL